MTLQVAPGVYVDSGGSSRDRAAPKQGEGAGVGPGVRGGAGVAEMRLLRETGHGVRLN